MSSDNSFLYQSFNIEDVKDKHFAIVVSAWNSEITEAMLQGAVDTFVEHGVVRENILIYRVPGTVELTYAASRILKSKKDISAIVVIGCVIKGDTPHFDYVCQSVTQGITTLNVQGEIPVIFSVVTTLNIEQARDRAGGKVGNKGSEGALTAMQMACLVFGNTTN